ncbi:hypothetical protein PsorP6_006747 [Peronosclerospora sorghi]|uniref:Uncharacterized protein n=1 Tax=Peronosclerospora sorghi TaxID=230839 RepID=A0ACC0W2U4_9STRA|nr:hypothetical protein PsorP6_006747 [Peronosclerospora sorghi]
MIPSAAAMAAVRLDVVLSNTLYEPPFKGMAVTASSWRWKAIGLAGVSRRPSDPATLAGHARALESDAFHPLKERSKTEEWMHDRKGS